MKRVSAYLLRLAVGGSRWQLGSRNDRAAELGSRPRGWVASAWSFGPRSSSQAARHSTIAGECKDNGDHESVHSSTDSTPSHVGSAAQPGALKPHHTTRYPAHHHHHHHHSGSPERQQHRHHAAPVGHSPAAGANGPADLQEQPAASMTVEQALKRPDTARALRALGRRSRDAAARSAAADESPGPPLMAVLGAMAGVMRGLGSSGLGPFTFGLQALGRKHEEQGLVDHPPGTAPLLPGGPAALAEAERLLEAMELAHGAYRKSAAALAATTCLRVQHVRVWRSQSGRLQPGYYIAVDHPGRRVVWGIRGTLAFSDLVTDLAMAAHPLPLRGAPHAAAHWGMTHAAHWLLQQEAQHVAALLRSLRGGPGGSSPYRLELVGHSLGGSVAALVAAMLREGLVEVARSAGVPPHLVSCTAFAPPAVMSPCLAAACRPYVTSVVLNHDVVPRFNADSLALLQQELQGVDWFAELQRTVMEHTMMKNITSTFGALTATTLNIIPPPSLPPPVTSAGAAAAAATSAAHTALSNGAGAAADAVQQLSAAVLRSGAFRSAIATLDEWKARMGTAPGEQAEAAVRRQAEVVRAWLQEVSNTAAAVAAGVPMADTRPRPLFPPPPGSPPYDPAAAAAPSSGPSADDEYTAPAAAAAAGGTRGASGSISNTRVVDPNSLAERLRQSVDSAMSSLMAAASAGRDRFVASANASVSSLPAMPSLPSLPAAHELPLVEPVAAAQGASGAAGGVAADATGAEFRRRQAQPAGARTLGGEQAAVEAEAGAEAAVAASVAGVPAAGQTEGVLAAALSHRPQDLPMLLPPGRILYIRPVLPGDHDALATGAATSAADGVGGSASIGPVPPPNAGVVSAPVNLVNSSKRGGKDSAAADLQQGQQPYASNQQFVLTELPKGTNFSRMVLGRASFNEHQCRSYRRVLMALAQQL